MNQEKVVAVIPNAIKKKFLSQKAYNLVFTPSRLIVAELTSQMVKDEVKRVNEQKKAEGKGFLSRWGSTMFAGTGVYTRYFEMPPDAILAEQPENFALTADQIQSYKVKDGRTVYEGDDTARRVPPEIEIKTASGKFKYSFGTGGITAREARQTMDTFLAHGFPSSPAHQAPQPSQQLENPPPAATSLSTEGKTFCPHCGTQLAGDANFCTECGKKQ